MGQSLFTRITRLIQNIHDLRQVCLPEYDLKLEYLTIFAQSDADFESLYKELQTLGDVKDANNGKKFFLSNPITELDEKISLIRVRKHDTHRSELGCGDLKYTEDQYKAIREKALKSGWDIIVRDGYEMIELSTFDLPVYAYLVKDL